MKQHFRMEPAEIEGHEMKAHLVPHVSSLCVPVRVCVEEKAPASQMERFSWQLPSRYQIIRPLHNLRCTALSRQKPFKQLHSLSLESMAQMEKDNFPTVQIGVERGTGALREACFKNPSPS